MEHITAAAGGNQALQGTKTQETPRDSFITSEVLYQLSYVGAVNNDGAFVANALLRRLLMAHLWHCAREMSSYRRSHLTARATPASAATTSPGRDLSFVDVPFKVNAAEPGFADTDFTAGVARLRRRPSR